jgi:capsular exopolysaccharide synthesis family protein
MEQYDQPVAEVGDSQESRFRDLVALLLRNKWLILITAAVCTVVLGAWTYMSPPTCEATTTVLINLKAGQQANPFQQGPDGATNKLANEMGILKARELAYSVAQNLLSDPYLDSAQTKILPIVAVEQEGPLALRLANVEMVTNRIQGAMTFTPEKESDIIKVSATSTSPTEAARLANVFAERYQERTISQSRSRSRQAREFLEGRLNEQRTALQQSESSLKGYMEATGVVTLDGNSRQVVDELSKLEATRNSLSIEIEGVNKRINTLQAELPQTESTVANTISQANDPYVKMLGEQLARLEVQRDVIVAQNDPAVLNQGVNQEKLKELNDQIAQLRENLRTRTNELIWGTNGSGGASGTQANPMDYLRQLREQLLEAKVQLETLRSRRTALEAIIAQYEVKFRHIPRESLDLARAQRERLSNERLYTMVEQKFNEATITEKSEFGYVDIIDRATAAAAKPRSRLMINTILGLILGFGLGVGIVVMKDAVDVRVRTPEQLRRNGFLSLSEIATLDEELSTLKANGSLPKEAEKFVPQLQLIFNPMSYTAECYRRLRTSLVRIQVKEKLNAVLVTSPNPSEGKSTTLLNLAISLAETEQKVLVIDTDLRKPVVHTMLGLAAAPGYTDVVAEEVELEKAIHHNVVPNLDVLTCGTAVKHPSRFFGHARTAEELNMLKKKYAWILMDAAPMLVVNDAAVLSTLVDGTLVLACAGETRLEALSRVLDLLEKAGGRMLGIVVNKFDPVSAYGSYYGSYKYGHYGYGGKNDYYHTSVNLDAKKN